MFKVLLKLDAKLNVRSKNKVDYEKYGQTGQLEAGTKLIDIILEIDDKDIIALYLIKTQDRSLVSDYETKNNLYDAFKLRSYFYKNSIQNGSKNLFVK